MSITTYTELQDAVTRWSKRTDLASLVPDFISLAEARIGRSLLTRTMETETELTTVQGSRYVNLPTGFGTALGLWLKANLPRESLPQRLPQDLDVSNTEGYPEWWAVDGDRIAFDKPAAGAWAFDFRYSTPFALSASSPTNYILTNYPDVYLFGALVELCMYAEDNNNSAIWESRFQKALGEASDEEHSNRSGATLMTDLGGMVGRNGFNVNRGY